MMTTKQFINEIERLPSNERLTVISFVKTLPNGETIDAMNEATMTLSRFNPVEDLITELEQWIAVLDERADCYKRTAESECLWSETFIV